MSIRTKAVTITGVASTETLDATGISPARGETMKLRGVHLSVTDAVGNRIVGYVGQTKVFDIYDYAVPRINASGTNQYPTTSAQAFWPIDRDLEEGRPFQIGNNCGGTADDVYAAYEWEQPD
jgi:hypothetical protein